MIQRLACTALLAALCGSVLAQTSTAPAMAAGPAPASSPAKRDLAKRWVAAQDQALGNLARGVVELPARQLLAAVEPVVRSRVAADKRDATARQLQDAARKYVDDTLPAVRKHAQELGQTQLQAAIEEKYSEEELRQIVAFFESAAFRKLQQTQPQLDQALQAKLLADMQPVIEGKARGLHGEMKKILAAAAPASAPASVPKAATPKAAAPAASKP